MMISVKEFNCRDVMPCVADFKCEFLEYRALVSSVGFQ